MRAIDASYLLPEKTRMLWLLEPAAFALIILGQFTAAITCLRRKGALYPDDGRPGFTSATWPLTTLPAEPVSGERF